MGRLLNLLEASSGGYTRGKWGRKLHHPFTNIILQVRETVTSEMKGSKKRMFQICHIGDVAGELAVSIRSCP